MDQPEDTKVGEVCQVRLDLLDARESYKALIKLHKQFVHPSKKRFVSLMKHADVWRQEFQDDIAKFCKKCPTCRQFAKRPTKMVVSIPMANTFKEAEK